jgi:predicted DNA-binding transcriptional regulator AlpA
MSNKKTRARIFWDRTGTSILPELVRCAPVCYRCYDGGAVRDVTYLNEPELSALLKVSRRTIQRWGASVDGPPFIRVGAKSIRYELTSCKTWADQRTFVNNAQELSARKS